MKITETGKRIEVKNGGMTISFSLSAEPGPLVNKGMKRWYAGSANSIRLGDGKGREIEMLDFNRHYSLLKWEGHDPEKRCMQIDKLVLHDPSFNANGVARIGIFDRDYEAHTITCDERECSILMWCPLESVFPNQEQSPNQEQTAPTYYLKRKIFLKKQETHVREEISVLKSNGGGHLPENAPPIEFEASYFTFMDCGRMPEFRKELREGRFTVALIGHQYAPRFSYGFACNRGIEITPDVFNPDPGYPNASKAHNSFLWQTNSCRVLQTVHLFKMGNDIDKDGMLLRQLQP